MEISSSAFAPNEMIPKQYTCQGIDISPPLHIGGPAPTSTKSFALIVHDHDSASGDFAHWVVWDINPSTEDIPKDAIPLEGVEGTNDFGHIGWGGPCPPSGTHRYEFHLYALDALMDLPITGTKTDLRQKMDGHIIEEVSIIGLYAKEK